MIILRPPDVMVSEDLSQSHSEPHFPFFELEKSGSDRKHQPHSKENNKHASPPDKSIDSMVYPGNDFYHKLPLYQVYFFIIYAPVLLSMQTALNCLQVRRHPHQFVIE